jgi:hypothetical protein
LPIRIKYLLHIRSSFSLSQSFTSSSPGNVSDFQFPYTSWLLIRTSTWFLCKLTLKVTVILTVYFLDRFLDHSVGLGRKCISARRISLWGRPKAVESNIQKKLDLFFLSQWLDKRPISTK